MNNQKINNIAFSKMQAAGNDFIVIDNRNTRITKDDLVSLAPSLCNRRFGIGADGIITLDPPPNGTSDYTMRYQNADGSDAGMCGNGARCLALFAAKNGFANRLSFEVNNTKYQAEIHSGEQVTIFFPMQVKIDERRIESDTVLQLYTGTEHIVKRVPSRLLNDTDFLNEEGKQLRNNPVFNPLGTNVNFIHGESKNTCRIQTYEKGVEGLTLACGTGAIASALAWHSIQQLTADKHYTFIVEAPGGTLQIGFAYNPKEHQYSNISLTGEARFVFEGTVSL